MYLNFKSNIIAIVFFSFFFLLPFHAFLVNSINFLFFTNQTRAPFWINGWKEIVLSLFFLVVFCIAIKYYKTIIQKIDIIDISILIFSIGMFLLGYFQTDSWFQLFLGVKYDLFFLWIFLAFRHVVPLFFLESQKIISLAIFVSGFFIIIFGWLQFFLPDTFLVSFGYFADPSVDTTLKPSSYCQLLENTSWCRSQSFFAGPIRLGAFLVMYIGILLLYFSSLSQKIKYSLLLLAGVVLVFTFSRAAWISEIVFLSALALQKYSISLKNTVFLVFIFLIGAISAVFFSDSLRHIILRVGSSSERWQGMMESIRISLENPWGLGLGQSGPASLYLEESRHLLSENWYLQIFTEGGMVFGLLFISISFFVWHALYRNNRMLSFLLLSLMIMACFTHVWEESSVAYSVWAMVGASLAHYVYRFNKNIS